MAPKSSVSLLPRLAVLALPAALLAFACASDPASTSATASGSPGDGSGGGETCAADEAPRCAPARHVATADDARAEIAKLAWQRVSLGSAGVLQVGDDLVADADLEIDASVIAAPPSCPAADAGAAGGACQTPLFRAFAFPAWGTEPSVAGVTCTLAGPRPVRKGETCARLAIAKGTTFRLRAVVEDMHPSYPASWPFVEIERPCATPCAATEARCASTQTCLAKGFATCAYCEGASTAECACRTTCGAAQPDGTACSFDTSPDTVGSGTCRTGKCTTTR